MELEKKLVNYVLEPRFEELPPKIVRLMKDVVLNVFGAIVAGAMAPACPEAVQQAIDWGGRAEATILVYGNRVSAINAAFANGFMARALVLDEAMVGGLHTGGSAIPAALAAAEMTGGCSGKEFLASLVTATELASRLHLSTFYNGFDATGVCVIFAATAAAARIMGLSREQMWHALGHAFNRSGGSWQGTIDGSVAARVLQGTSAQGGIVSAQLARKGISGPRNFLQGVYGYFHLFAGDNYDAGTVGGELGKRFDMSNIFLKKYPSCGTTNSSIDAMFDLMDRKGITADDIKEISVKVTPFTYNLTGKPFEYGSNPRVSAMYSIQYCIANTLLRRSCRLHDFDEVRVREPGVMEIVNKVRVFPEPTWDESRQLACELKVQLKSGSTFQKRVDFPKGTCENPLTKEELVGKLRDCFSYGDNPLPEAALHRLVVLVDRLEEEGDVRNLIPLLVSYGQKQEGR